MSISAGAIDGCAGVDVEHHPPTVVPAMAMLAGAASATTATMASTSAIVKTCIEHKEFPAAVELFCATDAAIVKLRGLFEVYNQFADTREHSERREFRGHSALAMVAFNISG